MKEIWHASVEQRNDRAVGEEALKVAAERKEDSDAASVARTFCWAPPYLRADKKLALMACSFDVSNELRDDRAIVLAAVRADLNREKRSSFFDQCVLAFASERLRNDREIVLAALDANGWALSFVGPGLKYENDVLVAAIAQAGLGVLKACGVGSALRTKAVERYVSGLLNAHDGFIAFLEGTWSSGYDDANYSNSSLGTLYLDPATRACLLGLLGAFVGIPTGHTLRRCRRVRRALESEHCVENDCSSGVSLTQT